MVTSDEYKREKLLSKIYEKRHLQVLKTKEKLYSIPIPKLVDEELKDQMKGFEKLKQASDDLPVKLKSDPFKSSIRKCIFCMANIPIDYKNTQLLSQFVSPQTGILYSQQVTGLCAHKYDEVAKAVTKSKRLGLMPYFHKESSYVTDPKLFDASDNKLKLIPDNLDKRKLNSD